MSRADPDFSLTESELRVVRAVRHDIMSTPVPASRGPAGCLAAIGGVVLLAAAPRLPAEVAAIDFLRPFFYLAGVVLALGGVLLSFFGGSNAGAAAGAAVEAALQRLEDPGNDRETMIRAATLLVSNATMTNGPATYRVFTEEEVRERVAATRPLVEAVELALRTEFGEEWTFTEPEPAP